ncbi:hypothetical protein B0H12DRAFT_1238247 [Mycena haematopus]|nr:hypothetical protein B0H12DRAFT_1238247 [Mycena haematopus]
MADNVTQMRDEVANLQEQLMEAHRRRREAEQTSDETINRFAAACEYYREEFETNTREEYQTLLEELAECKQRLEDAYTTIAALNGLDAYMREAEEHEQQRLMLEADNALVALNQAHERENAKDEGDAN